jgi:methionyl-tRNA formyltransferase
MAKLLVEAEGDLGALILMMLSRNFLTKSSEIILSTHVSRNNEELIKFSRTNGIRVETDGYTESFLSELSRCELSGVYSVYGRRRIPIENLDISQERTFNIHPSLLPQLAGCFSIPWAIINGLDCTGITYHRLAPRFDEGDIYFQQKVQVDPEDTAFSLSSKVVSAIISTFPDFYKKFLNGEHKVVPQSGPRSYYRRELPFAGRISKTWNSSEVTRFIRAMIYPPYKPATYLSADGTEHLVTSPQQYAEIISKES